MRLPSSAKLLRQQAVAVALLITAVLAVTAITITALPADPASAHRTSHSDPAATAVRGVVTFVEMFFGGGHWG
jgi:hypothetical protein